MNQRERMLAALSGETPDRIPRYAGFTRDLRDRLADDLGTDDFAKHFDMDANVGVGLAAPEGYQPVDYTKYFEGDDIKPEWISGLGVARVPGTFHHFTHIVSPLRKAKSLAEIEAFPIETQTGWDDSKMKQKVDEAHDQGKFVVGNITHLYEDAWQIRDYEGFLMDITDEPEWVDSILDRLTERNTNRARAAAEAGVDMIRSGDDVANQNTMMFSPATWRRLLKGRWAKIYGAAREVNPNIHIWYHSDGNIESIIPELMEIGVTVLNPVQPECLEPTTAKEIGGGKLALDGTIGTQTVFPFGTPDEMRENVKQRIQDLGPSRLILSPTHVLEPEVPVANIKAFFEACDEYGSNLR